MRGYGSSKLIFAVIGVVLHTYACLGAPLPPGALPSDAELCRQASNQAEASHHIPDVFLDAIARVETGRPDPQSGSLIAWPWSLNAQGVGSFYASKAGAIAAVRALQARGVKSIDVGCLQVNLLQHAGAFASLEQAFDPQANANYAADFLVALFGQTGSWPRAAAAYHSLTPGIGSPYQARVLAEWAVPQNEARTARHSKHADPVAAPTKPALSANFAQTHSAQSPLAQSPSAQSPSAQAPSAQAPSAQAPSARAPSARAPSAPEQFAKAQLAQIERPVTFASPGRLSAVTPPPARPSGMLGRSLAAYRATPTRMAFRTPG